MMWGSFFGGLLGVFIGFISVRVSFELVAVIFNINRSLEKLVALQSGESIKNEQSECCGQSKGTCATESAKASVAKTDEQEVTKVTDETESSEDK